MEFQQVGENGKSQQKKKHIKRHTSTKSASELDPSYFEGSEEEIIPAELNRAKADTSDGKDDTFNAPRSDEFKVRPQAPQLSQVPDNFGDSAISTGVHLGVRGKPSDFKKKAARKKLFSKRPPGWFTKWIYWFSTLHT